MTASFTRLVARLVMVSLLTVNFAWAADIHGPGLEGMGAATTAAPLHGADGPAADSHDGHDHGTGHDHCLHCFSGNAHQPTVDFRIPPVPPAAVAVLPPELDPDRPPSRSGLPPERPPRA